MTFTATSKRRAFDFVCAALSFALVYAAASAPVPLFQAIRADLSLVYGDLSLAAVVYFACAVASLLFFGRISDVFGRKPVCIANLVIAALGVFLFADIASVVDLCLARALQGCACGLASGTLAAYIVETAPTHPRWLAAAATGIAPMAGLAAGSLVTGASVQYDLIDAALLFCTLTAVLLLCAVLFVICRETHACGAKLSAVITPRFEMPQSVKREMLVSTPVFVATWCIGGFYLPFSASMASDLLASDSSLIAGLIFALMMTPYALGSFLAGKLNEANARRYGMVSFSLLFVGIVAALKFSLAGIFLALTALAGVAWGMAFSAGLSRVLAGIEATHRTGVLSSVFALSYAGAAVPNMIVGLTHTTDLLTVAYAYAAFVVSLLIVFLIMDRRQPKAAEQS